MVTIATAVAQWVVILAVTITVFLSGARIESLIYPVAKVQVTDGYWDGDDYVFRGFITKNRLCEFKGMFFKDTRRNTEYIVKFPPRSSEGDPDVSRPTGDSVFVEWRMIKPQPGALVVMSGEHRCHDLWNTWTELGTMRIPLK